MMHGWSFRSSIAGPVELARIGYVLDVRPFLAKHSITSEHGRIRCRIQNCQQSINGQFQRSTVGMLPVKSLLTQAVTCSRSPINTAASLDIAPSKCKRFEFDFLDNDSGIVRKTSLRSSEKKCLFLVMQALACPENRIWKIMSDGGNLGEQFGSRSMTDPTYYAACVLGTWEYLTYLWWPVWA